MDPFLSHPKTLSTTVKSYFRYVFLFNKMIYKSGCEGYMNNLCKTLQIVDWNVGSC